MKKTKKTYGHYYITDDFYTGNVLKVGRFSIPDGDTIENRAKRRLSNYKQQCKLDIPEDNQRDPELFVVRDKLIMVVVGETLSLTDAKSYENHMIDRHHNPRLLNKIKNKNCPKYAGVVRTMETVVMVNPRCAA